MQLVKIPYSLVAADNAAVKAIQDSSHPSSRSQRFNTTTYQTHEIPPVVPKSSTFKHEPPPWTAYSYTLWHPLIARSQRLTEYHEILIPSFLYEGLMRCHGAWVAHGSLLSSLLDEVMETLRCTKSGKKLAPPLDGSRKWFIRQDQIPPQDSPCGGQLPSSTFEEVLTKICTSTRAYGCLQGEFADAKREGRDAYQASAEPVG